MNKGVDIYFGNMPFNERLSIWWSFTLGCLFKRSVRTKYKVKSITIADSPNTGGKI